MKNDFLILSYFNDEIVNQKITALANNLKIEFANPHSDTGGTRNANAIILIYEDDQHSNHIKNLINKIVSFKISTEFIYVFAKKGIAIPIEWEFNHGLVLEMTDGVGTKEFYQKLDKTFEFYTADMANHIEYEKLYEYDKIKSYAHTSMCVQKIVESILKRMRYYGPRYNTGANYLRRLNTLLNTLAAYRVDTYSPENKIAAKNNLEMCKDIDDYIQDFRDIIKIREVHTALSILIYTNMEIIDAECRHILTEGRDIHILKSDYNKKTEKLFDILKNKDHSLPDELYHGDDAQLVERVLNSEGKNGKYLRLSTPNSQTQKNQDDELLISIANFINEGNKIFSHISKKDNSEEFLECLKLSYERLRNYCQIVGAGKIAEVCVEKIFELKQMQAQSRPLGETVEKADKGLKALLGVKLPESGRFDAFISHKGTDIDIATDIYNLLKKNLKTAFLDKETLPRMSNAEYLKAIFQALDCSEHLIVVLSDVSYLNKRWVESEMNTFLGEILDGRKPYANIIFVVTPEVNEQLKNDKTLMPPQFRDFEIIPIDQCDKGGKLVSYIK